MVNQERSNPSGIAVPMALSASDNFSAERVYSLETMFNQDMCIPSPSMQL